MTSPDTKDDKTEKKEQTYRQTGLTIICFQKQYNLIWYKYRRNWIFFFTSVSFHDNITFPHNWFNQNMHAVQEEKKTYIDWNDICTQ